MKIFNKKADELTLIRKIVRDNSSSSLVKF